MPTLNFIGKPTKTDTQIYAVLRGAEIMKGQKMIYTGYHIDPLLWDKKKRRVKNCLKSAEINKRLSTWENRFQDYLDKCRNFEQKVDLSQILGLFEADAPQVNKNSLSSLFDIYVKDKRIKDRTKAKYDTVKDNVLQYEKEHGTVRLGDVNEDFYNKFVDFLIKQDNQNKTIARKIKSIKTVMGYAAFSKKLVHSIEWQAKIQLRDAKTYRTFLTNEEVFALYNYRSIEKETQQAIDAFILSIFTGLRYSDVIQLTDNSIKSNEEGKYLSFYSQKTSDNDTVPLPDFIYSRLEKYLGGKLFDCYPDSIYMNKIIKRVCRQLGFNRMIEVVRFKGIKREVKTYPLYKLVSFHWARYSYIHILDTLKIQATYIQDNVGHSDLKTTNGYLQTDTENRIRETNKALQSFVKIA